MSSLRFPYNWTNTEESDLESERYIIDQAVRFKISHVIIMFKKVNLGHISLQSGNADLLYMIITF